MERLLEEILHARRYGWIGIVSRRRSWPPLISTMIMLIQAW